ncbi:hypothetical protein [Enterobacter cloacae]|uniref:hypothetical protein n=1 Tax=Enterobacter cloacae TaxID=550 RepID=UPI001865F075|nr:hypothetical protein [Enterobacter cloacae]
MITEKINVFYCDCGFSFQRGHSGTHDCADGLRIKLAESEARCAALAAENAGLKAAVTQQIELRAEIKKAGRPPHADFWVQSICEAEEKVKRALEDTPITDAYLAEVRACGVDAAIATAKNVVAQEFQYKDFETAQRVCSKFPESDLVGKVELVEWLEDFAALIRKGVQS